MSWARDCKTALKKALLEVAHAGRKLQEPLGPELPKVPVPDPGDWEICEGVRWPARHKGYVGDNWGISYVYMTRVLYVDHDGELERLVEGIVEGEGRVPSRILQVIRRLEELRDHLVRLTEERKQAARAVLESPEEQEAIAAIRDRLALLKLRDKGLCRR
jgi:hypothetical protein